MKTVIELRKEYNSLIRSRLDEVCEINRKYDSAPSSQRSDEDQKRFKQLFVEMKEIADNFDKKYPWPNCPECGSRRSARVRVCYNHSGNCSLAVPLGG